MTNQEKRKQDQQMAAMSRRDFLKVSGIAGGSMLLGIQGGMAMAGPAQQVALATTSDRRKGVQSSMGALNINPVKNKDVLIKPNFNTADITPGSTHNDTLVALIDEIWKMGAKSIRLGERSFPLTERVMAEKGILPLLKKRDVTVINFDTLAKKDWVKVQPKNSHWKDGFRVARPILDAECLVSTCCLKTHQYGGVFTLSLKLHVGVVPTKRHGFDYMTELHYSPDQRKMIAEINAPFSPDLVVLDGIDAFVDGGPMEGKQAKGNVFLAATDRVAIDAVGVAVLKALGSNDQIMKPKIFKQEQIARAVDIGLGVSGPSEIALIAADKQSESFRDRIAGILDRG
ncbi:MAG: DUF362 domain-containing protein [Desulfobacterales bacterium]